MEDAEALFLKGDAAEDAGDFVLARQSFERGAALGDAICWSRLGLMFDVGHGVDVDKTFAMRCYRKAWRGHCDVAANNIAILYRETGNWRLMFRWFRRAADTGDGDALVELAKCFRDGVGVRKSIDEAFRCADAATRVPLYITEAGREDAQISWMICHPNNWC